MVSRSLDRVPRRYRLPLAATVAVALALAGMPGIYYVVLQYFLCGACVYYISTKHAVLPDRYVWLLVALAVVHNPIVPFPLGSWTTWLLLNAGTVLYFWVVAGRGFRR
jgi:hypothetical protein